jgi:hypothetical protein
MKEAFPWHRQMTRHFGEQWIPVAELHVQAASGRWRKFSLRVDSGAVISVLTRSAADLLGIPCESGEEVDLTGIGAGPRRYFVHRVIARIGGMQDFEMRIAFADREDVPNLLGRLDLIDRFDIILKARRHETRFRCV